MTLAVAAVPAVSQSPSSSAAATPPPTLQQRVDTFLEESGIPGVGAAVVEVDRPTRIAVSGRRAAGVDAPIEPDDLWHLGSITKSFTATLYARLIERGTPLDDGTGDRLGWDTPLGRLLPTARGTPFEDVPVRLFLAHRSGMVANPSMARIAQRDTTTPMREQRAEVAAELLGTEPASTPGSAMLYSNAGYIVAGAALEELLETSWEELLRREVLEPLDLASAGFGPPGTVDGVDQPRGHLGQDNGALRAIPPTPLADNAPLLGPAGTLHMSLADLAAYARAHLEGERGRDGLVSAETFRRLHTPDDGQGYALGWVRFAAGEGPAGLIPGDVWMHNGSNTLWYAVVFFSAEAETAVAVTTNAGLHNARAVNDFALELMKASGALGAGEESVGDEARLD